MHRIPTRPFAGTASSVIPNRRMEGLLRSSRPIRCLIIACVSVAAGWLIRALLPPDLISENAEELLIRHLPAHDVSFLQFWLKLCIARLPFWLLIALAGFTRFSGGLTSAVLVYRGLCDGFAWGFLFEISSEQTRVSPSVACSAQRLLVAFSVWAATDLLIRLFMTLKARKIADMEWESREIDGRISPAVKAALLQYIAVCLSGLCATAVSCCIYTVFLYM